MLQLKAPGIYTREIPSGVRTITAAPTSVTLFVGPTKSGIDGRPTRIFNFPEFERLFGGLSQASSLSYSVNHFFGNGGGEAFVLRVPAANAVAAQSSFKRNSNSNAASITVTALSSGAASGEVYLEFDAFGIAASPYGANPDLKRFNLTIIDRLTGRLERFTNLSTASSSARFVRDVINDVATGSKLVKVDVVGIDQPGPKPSGTVYPISLPNAMPAGNVNLELNVTRIDAAGANDAANSVSVQVPVYAAGASLPASIPEVVKTAVAAMNKAINDDATASDRMGKLEIEGVVFVEDNASFVRFRVAMAGSGTLNGRVTDATVAIAAPNAGSSFAATFLGAGETNHSRYQLGAKYQSTQVMGGQAAPVAGDDGVATGQPSDAAFLKAITDLETPDPFFNILCLPDIVRPSATDPLVLEHTNAPAVYTAAAQVCQKKYAFLLVDPLPNVVDAGTAEAWKTLGFFQSSHAAAYYPNIRVDDLLVPGIIRSHPPSGAIAGVYARIDGLYGPWHAPAGTEAVLNGVYGPSVDVNENDQGVLNPIGLNCLRRFPIYQTVVFGSRTVDGANAMASDWKYIPVRRTADLILRSLVDNLRWAVHSPNGEELWSQLRISVTAFMHGLFRRGAFKGVSSRDAYFVTCDSSTTTADDINQGIVNIVVGFAPLKPAEFVVISLRQIVQPATV